MINGSFEAMDTPGKKRKRESLQKFVSSTPIKLSSNKENFLFSDSCMEVKSIAELVAERKSQLPANEYEVIRKPPKKKKKSCTSAVEECCFINPGLDLKVDEKVINPFEVVRDDNTEAKLLALGVENPALDIQNEPVVSAPVVVSTNPFEVMRCDGELSKTVNGIENNALDLNPVRALVLPLPFTPTVNHRIDFSNMPENLTPSSLFSSKLVLENNEVKITVATPKRSATVTQANRSLSIISEEEGEIDIGAELDNYQLQLENSINEAKMQNRPYDFNKNNQNEEEEEKVKVDDATYTKETLKIIEEVQSNIEMLAGLKESDVDDENIFNDDVQFEEVDSFEDVGKLGQFKRAYRTEAPAAIFKKPLTEIEIKPKPSATAKLGGSIRRSIRRFIHPKAKENTENDDEKHDGIFQTIRQSLRRKPKTETAAVGVAESLETTMVGRSVFREMANDEIPKRTLERRTLKRNVIKTVKTFMESVEEFDHY